MGAKKVRIVSATGETITGREESIIFNAAGAISFNLGPAYGDGRSFDMKNIGAGAVTLVPYGSDVIWEGASAITKVLNQGESVSLTDAQSETWVSSYTDFETTPLNEGGTGITTSGVTNVFYVDAGRADSYTEDGSILRPYKTILGALTVINADSLIHQAASAYTLACYVINVAPGTYSDNLTIGNVKNLKINMECGVFVTGSITYTTTMVGGTADNYYSRLELCGAEGNRVEKGPAARMSGLFTATRNNDSLCYVSLKGIHYAGNMFYNTNGTWVVSMKDVFFSGYLYTGSSAIVLLETTGHTMFGAYSGAGTGHIAVPSTNAVVAVSLYNCDNTEFDLINISNAVGSRITNCRFLSDVTITAGTVYIDNKSYKSLLAITETLTGATLSYLDTVSANITAVARTTGAVSATAQVDANIDALDAAIGFEAQMSGTPHVVTFPTTVFQALDKLDTYKSVQTIKKTIGGVGVAGCDFNFATAADTTEQVINLGALLPAKARLVDIFTFTDAVFTGATTLVAEIGTSSSGNELIGSATIYAANAITAAANAGAFIATPSASATSIYVSATPGANWSNVTAGKVSVYVTFINVTNI